LTHLCIGNQGLDAARREPGAQLRRVAR
jgi:hypothetical protein